jgi:hypothetical protein
VDTNNTTDTIAISQEWNYISIPTMENMRWRWRIWINNVKFWISCKACQSRSLQ